MSNLWPRKKVRTARARMEPVVFLLESHKKRALTNLCRAHEITPSEQMRFMVTEWLEKVGEEKQSEQLERGKGKRV